MVAYWAVFIKMFFVLVIFDLFKAVLNS